MNKEGDLDLEYDQIGKAPDYPSRRLKELADIFWTLHTKILEERPVSVITTTLLQRVELLTPYRTRKSMSLSLESLQTDQVVLVSLLLLTVKAPLS